MDSVSARKIDKNQLVTQLKDKLTPIFKKFNVDFAYLAGSIVRDEHQWWSDVDIFVSFPKFTNLDGETKLKVWTQMNNQAINATSEEKIEIRYFEQLPLHIQFEIIKEGIVIFETSKEERTEFIESLLNQYYDHKIWFDDYLKQSLENAYEYS